MNRLHTTTIESIPCNLRGVAGSKSETKVSTMTKSFTTLEATR
ncbi:hypothetical protein [Congregicoccus parvus]